MIECLCHLWAAIVAAALSGLMLDTRAAGDCFFWAGGGLRVIPGCLAPRAMLCVALAGMAWFAWRRRWCLFLLAPAAAAAGSILRLLILAIVYRASWDSGELLHNLGTWPAGALGIVLLIALNRLPRRLFIHG